jgi:hypothetical protein
MSSAPACEPLVEADHTTLGPLVRVRHDALFEGGGPRPRGIRLIGQPAHRVAVHGRRELLPAVGLEPARRRMAMAQDPERVVSRERLVDVMQQRRGLDEGPLDRAARAGQGVGQEGRHVRRDHRVLRDAAHRSEREQQCGCFQP